MSEIERELAQVKRDYELHMAGSAQMEADIAKALRLEVGDEDAGEREYWIPADPGPLGPFTGIEEAARQFVAFIDKTDASSREQLATLRADNERLKQDVYVEKSYREAAEARVKEVEQERDEARKALALSSLEDMTLRECIRSEVITEALPWMQDGPVWKERSETAERRVAELKAALKQIAEFDENAEEESWQETFERMKAIADRKLRGEE